MFLKLNFQKYVFEVLVDEIGEMVINTPLEYANKCLD